MRILQRIRHFAYERRVASNMKKLIVGSVYIANDMTDDKLDIMQKVDDMIDDGDLSCGKLRRQGGINLMYSISRTNAL